MFIIRKNQYTYENAADLDYTNTWDTNIWLRDYTYEDTIIDIDFWGIEFSFVLMSKFISKSEEYLLEM